MTRLDALLAEARACRVCAAHLPLGPRPILRARESARLLIVGQAPGFKVHETGIPFYDRSGDRLLQWLGLTRAQFYDERTVAFVPTGFCYPGRDASGGDLPPRAECAPLWHPKLRPALPHIETTLLIGSHAQKYYLGARRKKTVAETVRAWREFLPEFWPLPHPSWRNTNWLAKNPWFEAKLVPQLKKRIAEIFAG